MKQNIDISITTWLCFLTIRFIEKRETEGKAFLKNVASIELSHENL